MSNTIKTDPAAETLAKQVAERQKFIEEIVSYVSSLAARRGRVLRKEVHSCHTTTEIELKNFAGFSFYTYGSYTMFGGETVKVWHHPNSKEIPAEPVFEVEFWDIAKCTVQHFNLSTDWQEAIRKLMANTGEIEAHIDQEQKKQEEEEGRAADARRILYQEEQRLQKEAVRLKLK